MISVGAGRGGHLALLMLEPQLEDVARVINECRGGLLFNWLLIWRVIFLGALLVHHVLSHHHASLTALSRRCERH